MLQTAYLLLTSLCHSLLRQTNLQLFRTMIRKIDNDLAEINRNPIKKTNAKIIA
ncbi:MAG: hypothetical protein JWQ09_2015 [Segetibacter sp.]|nr:hypothetical protein [Segetibacter sp.]